MGDEVVEYNSILDKPRNRLLIFLGIVVVIIIIIFSLGLGGNRTTPSINGYPISEQEYKIYEKIMVESPPVMILSDYDVANVVSMVKRKNGDIVVSFDAALMGDSGGYVIISKDDGETWSDPQKAVDTWGWGKMIEDEDETLLWFANDIPNSGLAVYVSQDGIVWDNGTSVTSRVNSGVQDFFLYGEEYYLSYRHNDSFYLAKTKDFVSWSEEITLPSRGMSYKTAMTKLGNGDMLIANANKLLISNNSINWTENYSYTPIGIPETPNMFSPISFVPLTFDVINGELYLFFEDSSCVFYVEKLHSSDCPGYVMYAKYEDQKLGEPKILYEGEHIIQYEDGIGVYDNELFMVYSLGESGNRDIYFQKIPLK